MNNKYKKTVKKVGEGKYGHYGHPTAIVGGTRVESPKSKVQSRGLRLRAAGLVIFAVAAVWAVMPTSGAEAVN